MTKVYHLTEEECSEGMSEYMCSVAALTVV